MQNDRYTVNIYCGRKYCGNGFFETFEECVRFLDDDGFADYARIRDNETGRIYRVHVSEQ